jgi:hypothetical protein
MAVLAGMFLVTQVSVADVFDIQAAIDKHAGGVITVPAGEHRIRQPLEIRGDNTVLEGHGTIVQENIDLHCDHTLVSGNLIDHCMIGLKATHGCEGLTLVGNTITHVDLWGIVLNPGALSAEDNPDRAILIANNTILAYGHGHEYWNWGGGSDDAGSSYAIALFDGQLAENPPLREVLISGNVVGGNPGPPRYRYAVAIRSWWGTAEESPNMPDAPQFQGNLFTPGREGVSNVPLSHVAPTPP